MKEGEKNKKKIVSEEGIMEIIAEMEQLLPIGTMAAAAPQG